MFYVKVKHKNYRNVHRKALNENVKFCCRYIAAASPIKLRLKHLALSEKQSFQKYFSRSTNMAISEESAYSLTGWLFILELWGFVKSSFIDYYLMSFTKTGAMAFGSEGQGQVKVKR